MKVREVIQRLEQEGWVLDRTRGSHRQYYHPGMRRLVTVAGKPNDDVPKGTLGSIFRQAGWKK